MRKGLTQPAVNVVNLGGRGGAGAGAPGSPGASIGGGQGGAGGAGCCGPIQDRIDLIKQVGRGLRDGHFGIAELYDKIAEDIEDPTEKKQFTEKAKWHRDVGNKALEVLVPDGVEVSE